MSITIQGTRLKTINITRDNESGARKITGSYELISSDGVILATQSYGKGYDALDVPFSKETVQLMRELNASIKDDLNTTLGVN